MLSKLARYLLRNNENFKKLDAMLSKPEVWEYDGYRLRHRTRILSFWMANGITFFNVFGEPGADFGFLMKFALWGKAKKLMIKKDKLKELLQRIELEETK